MSATRTRLAVAATALAIASSVMAAGTAQASDDVVRRGACSGSAHWKIKAKPDDGRVEVETEIDSNRVGQSWTWVLRHNGNVAARGSSFTKAPSGSFSVERRTANAPGADHFAFRGTHAGQVCLAKVSL